MKTEEVKTKRVFNLIIVDESGSMSIIRKQAFAGMNETLQTVRQMQEKFPDQEQHISLVTFDTSHTTWHYDNTPASDTKNLDWKAYNPGVGTPLYDAMGSAISKVNAQIADGDNVLVTVITDGEENSSQEWTLKMIRTITSTWRLWLNPSPSRNTWSSSRPRQEPVPCLPANAVAANATTAVLPRMPPCPRVRSSKKKSLDYYKESASAITGADSLSDDIAGWHPA